MRNIVFYYLLLLFIIILIILFSKRNINLYLSSFELYDNYLKNIKYSDIALKQKNTFSWDIPILYINLERSKERRNFMEKQFKNLNIKNTHRIKAFDGSKLKNKLEGEIQGWSFKNDYKDKVGEITTEYEICCCLSHLKAMTEALNMPEENFLILEDDANFSFSYLWPDKSFNEIISKAPLDWEILQLYSSIEKISGNTLRKYTSDDYGTVAYIINKNGIKKILNQVKYDPKNKFLWIREKSPNFPIYLNSDYYIYNSLKTYVYGMNMFFSGDLPSTIHRDHEDGHIKVSEKTANLYLELNPQLYLINTKQMEFFKVLMDMNDFLSENGIEYMITEGTLLGFYRENQFIEHDPDIDLMIFKNDYKKCLEQDSEKFKFKHNLYSEGDISEITFTHKRLKINVDIFMINKGVDGSYWINSFFGICNKSKIGNCRWKCPKIIREEADFMGIKVGIPKDPEAYLIGRYGINWNVPLNYNYFEGIDKDLYKGLIKSDFPKGFFKENPKEKKISEFYPEKIRKMSKEKPIIWMYLENLSGKTKIPYIDLCLETIEKYNKDKFHIIILNPENIPIISRYIHKNFTNINPSMRANYVRFCIVAEYGGIWLDSCTFNVKDLSLLSDTLKIYNFASFNTGIFAGNPNNKICCFYKNLFERGEHSKWIYEKYEIPLDWGNSLGKAFMKKIEKFYDKECKTFSAKDMSSLKFFQ